MRVSQDDAIRRLLLALNIEPANNAQSETGYGRDYARYHYLAPET